MQKMGDAAHPATRVRVCRFLVLSDMNEPAPRPLLKLFAKRGLPVRVAPDAASVMVELAKEQTSVVVVNEPKRKLGMAQILKAMAAYYPTIPCWQYQTDERGEPSLTPLIEAPPYEPPDFEQMSPIRPFESQPLTPDELSMLTDMESGE